VVVVGVGAAKFESGVDAVVMGSVAALVVFDDSEEVDEPLVDKAENRLNMSMTTLLTSF
jgi:hypothetical protein